MEKEENSVGKKEVTIRRYIAKGILMILLFYGLFYVSYCRFPDRLGNFEKESENIIFKKNDEVEIKRIKKRLDLALLKANKNIKKDFEDFNYELSKSDVYFDDARLNIPKTVESLTSLKACFSTTKEMIEDRFNKTNNAKENIYRIINDNVIQNCEQGVEQSNDALKNFNLKIAEEQTNLNIEFIEILKSSDLKLKNHDDILEDLSNNLELTSDMANDIALKTSYASGGLLVAPFVSSSLIKVLGRIVGKFLAKTATVSWLPVVDGPLPIGDICFALLEAAFIASDAYELKKTQVDLTRDLNNKLRDAVERSKDKTQEGVLNCAEKIIDDFNSKNKEKVNDIIDNSTT